MWGKDMENEKTLSRLIDEMRYRKENAGTDFERLLYGRFIIILEEYIPSV